CAQPFRQLRRALARDPKVSLRALVAIVFRLDEPVTLEPLQCRVHLADVQRPHLARSVLELLAKLQPVLRPVTQQRQQGVADAHRPKSPGSILSIVPGDLRSRKAPRPEGQVRVSAATPSTRASSCGLRMA